MLQSYAEGSDEVKQMQFEISGGKNLFILAILFIDLRPIHHLMNRSQAVVYATRQILCRHIFWAKPAD